MEVSNVFPTTSLGRTNKLICQIMLHRTDGMPLFLAELHLEVVLQHLSSHGRQLVCHQIFKSRLTSTNISLWSNQGFWELNSHTRRAVWQASYFCFQLPVVCPRTPTPHLVLYQLIFAYIVHCLVQWQIVERDKEWLLDSSLPKLTSGFNWMEPCISNYWLLERKCAIVLTLEWVRFCVCNMTVFSVSSVNLNMRHNLNLLCNQIL